MSAPSDSKRVHSPLTGRYAPKVTAEHHAAAHFLASEGLSCRKIAARLGLHHSTVATLLREPFDPVLWRALHDPELLELAATEEA